MIEPYIYFNGDAKEAIEFYERVFKGEGKQIMYYKDAPSNPEFNIPDSMRSYVLHSEITINSTKVHFSDSMTETTKGNNISFALQFHTPDEVKDKFNELKEGGEVLMELAPQFFSPMYGWVKDKFGISWQLISK